MEDIIETLESDIEDSKHYGDDPEHSSWQDETGILITQRDAERILTFIKLNSKEE